MDVSSTHKFTRIIFFGNIILRTSYLLLLLLCVSVCACVRVVPTNLFWTPVCTSWYMHLRGCVHQLGLAGHTGSRKVRSTQTGYMIYCFRRVGIDKTCQTTQHTHKKHTHNSPPPPEGHHEKPQTQTPSCVLVIKVRRKPTKTNACLYSCYKFIYHENPQTQHCLPAFFQYSNQYMHDEIPQTQTPTCNVVTYQYTYDVNPQTQTSPCVFLQYTKHIIPT